MNNDKINKVKEIYNKYKEAKKDPRKKAGIKLLKYLIFFIILLLFATITNNMPTKTTNVVRKTTTTTKVVDKYVEKQNKLITNKFNITYEIKYNEINYVINGILDKNIINGYLEVNNDVKKVLIRDNEVYEAINELNNKIEVEFNLDYINLNYILNIVKQNSAFIKEKDNIKTYLYELDEENIKIYVKTDESNITEINIEELSNQYILKFDN